MTKIDESREFQREFRYIVFKLSDLGNSIKGDEIRKLSDEYAAHRAEKGKAPLACVVIESDWPEYETVWQMIEDRVTGRSARDGHGDAVGAAPVIAQIMRHAELIAQNASYHGLVATSNCISALRPMLEQLIAASDDSRRGDDMVLVPRGLIGAACSAIDKQRDAPKVLEQLRRYTFGDLSQAPSAAEKSEPDHAAPRSADKLLSYEQYVEIGQRNKLSSAHVESVHKDILEVISGQGG